MVVIKISETLDSIYIMQRSTIPNHTHNIKRRVKTRKYVSIEANF